jgi:two-component system, OmpR family, sensor histidine kinase PrrB
MKFLSRIFARTPSLRTRVVLATAIGAAIPVLIVGIVVWVGITNDRKERLDRRLDEAAGFAIPFVGRGMNEIPRSPNDQDAIITVRLGGMVESNSDVTLPKLNVDYADAYVNGVRYRVRTVDIPGPGPRSVAVGATYDATVAETNNLHRRVLLICGFAIFAATVFAWLLASFAVRPFKQLAQQTRSIDAGDEAPRVEVHGATEAVEIAEAMRGMLQRIWNEQNRTKEALASARDFAAVSSHELRTPLTAMRTNLEVLSTLDLADDQRKEVLTDVIRTQSRIEATLSALERLAQGELSTFDDHVPVDITDLLDRAAHDASRIYPDLDVSLVPSPTCIIVGLPAGLRLAVDNAIANAVKHGGATRCRYQRSAHEPEWKSPSTTTAADCPKTSARWSSSDSPAGRPRRIRGRVWDWRWWPSRPTCTAGRLHCTTARWAESGYCCVFPGPADTVSPSISGATG